MSIQKTYASRRNAKDKLISILEDKKIDPTTTELLLNISSSEISFFIHKIESVTKASVEAKFLYKIHDPEDLHTIEIH